MRALFLTLFFLGQGGLAVKISTASQSDKFTQVIGVLQTLVNQLQEEASADEGLFDSFKCYCKNNKEQVQLSLDQEKSESDRLQANWKASEEKSAEKGAEVKNHNDQISQLQLQLEDARMRRQTENEEFSKTSAELKEDVRQILDAITALAARVPGGVSNTWNAKDILTSLVQADPDGKSTEDRTTAYFGEHADLMKSLTTKYLDQESEDDLSDALESIGGDPLAFVQENPITGASQDLIIDSILDAGGQINVAVQTVFGYLASMRDTAVTETNQLAVEEKHRLTSFNDLREALEAQTNSLRSAMNKKNMQSAESQVAAENAKADFQHNQKRIASGEAFLDELTVTCSKKATDYDELVNQRNAEMVAVRQAMEVLQGARIPETVLSPSLIETGSREEPDTHVDANTAKAVVSALQGQVASKSKQVSMLTYMLKTANVDFSSVLKVIDNLQQELADEQGRDDQHLSNCKMSLDASADEEAEYTSEIDRLKAFISEADATVDEAEDKIADLGRANADLDSEAKSASVQRDKEKTEYDKVLNEKTEQVQVVETAVRVLRSVYESTAAVQEDEWTLPEDAPTFVQVTLHLDQAPEPPAPHKLKGQGFSAIGMLAEIENDLKIEVTTLQADEQDSIREYQRLQGDISHQQIANNNAIQGKKYQVAENNSRSGEFQVEQDQAEEKLQAAKELHDARQVECTAFMTADDNKTESGYDTRKRLRQADADAIVRAKALLTARR